MTLHFTTQGTFLFEARYDDFSNEYEKHAVDPKKKLHEKRGFEEPRARSPFLVSAFPSLLPAQPLFHDNHLSQVL